MQNTRTRLHILRGRKPSKYVNTIVLEAGKPKHAKNLTLLQVLGGAKTVKVCKDHSFGSRETQACTKPNTFTGFRGPKTVKVCKHHSLLLRKGGGGGGGLPPRAENWIYTPIRGGVLGEGVLYCNLHTKIDFEFFPWKHNMSVEKGGGLYCNLQYWNMFLLKK